jgi:hypothetical protein
MEIRGVGELRGHAHCWTVHAQTSFDHVTNPELPGHLGQADGAIAENE